MLKKCVYNLTAATAKNGSSDVTVIATVTVTLLSNTAALPCENMPLRAAGPFFKVECLIDLATDPDVLGRQYIGLATWV